MPGLPYGTKLVTGEHRVGHRQGPNAFGAVAADSVPGRVRHVANVGTDSRYVLSQMVAVAVPKRLFWAIPGRIGRLGPPKTVPG